MKIPRRFILVDRLHRLGVYTCMGITIASTTFLIYTGYQVLFTDRPSKKQIQDAELLNAGKTLES